MNYLVIGGATGIGKRLTEILLEKGHKVHVASRNAKANLEEDSNLVVNDLDAVDSDTDWSFLPEELDGVAYCAGTINLKPFKRLKPEDFKKDFDVNLIGAVNTIQAALPALKKGNGGSILLFSSVAAQRGLTFHASVAAAKGAIEGLTRALSAELAPDIRVNALALSLTDTPLAQNLLSTDKKKESSNDRHPLKRYGKPNDAASIGAFLLSADADWITGQVIGVDGGMGTIQNI
ncbi:SDR family oxidoreductase [Cryomorpha ignava]|uniref:SDR family oxidoreductase n=1 Tax=Cryomorpha ignava TaxID=101383 RepID=A0A7K3WKB7_9FLAO|nr:SDR family oxidoreductase [Cryomorpha ignava]NEN22079.1 SDR family oxidoreductase [Cryomorpha ignava]